ncbi:hypothetical protein B0I21_11087 [Sphingobacterium paludis]|uniref:Uncharacterized protein n=1 Tax=Sphingobacterium paludis TaxID=1476465 RepID=A0A4R7CX17_9SPHI|nr:hypothetical protein B0I21_11087 [Sphingobacterium paludis]
MIVEYYGKKIQYAIKQHRFKETYSVTYLNILECIGHIINDIKGR